MTTPREQLATAINAALNGVAYSARDAISHAAAFEDLVIKVERHLRQAGWQPPIPDSPNIITDN